MKLTINFGNIKKKIKAFFSGWDAKLAQKLEKWRMQREMNSIAKRFPVQDIKPLPDDDHIIAVDLSKATTNLDGKILEVKPVDIHSSGGRIWYASKKEGENGTTEYEIRNNQQSQEAFSKHVDEQRKKESKRGW